MEQIVETECHIQPTEEEMVSLESEEKRKSGSKHPTHCRRQPRLTLIFIRFSKRNIMFFLRSTDCMHYPFLKRAH